MPPGLGLQAPESLPQDRFSAQDPSFESQHLSFTWKHALLAGLSLASALPAAAQAQAQVAPAPVAALPKMDLLASLEMPPVTLENPALAATISLPPAPKPALTGDKVSSVVDDALTTSAGPAGTLRKFGHVPVRAQLFDTHGNWADNQTAVSADQAAAMPASERQTLAKRAGVSLDQLQLGDAERVTVYPAVDTPGPYEQIDMSPSYKTLPSGERSFGHKTTWAGYFWKGRWADNGRVVSADQAAAMTEGQRQALAQSAGVEVGQLRQGQASRAIVDILPGSSEFDTLKPTSKVTFMGHKMTALTAATFDRLVQRVHERFPDRDVRVTATVEGQHVEKKHYLGMAVDFVVDDMTPLESKQLGDLAQRVGFKAYNEYVKDSRFKTGPHMHVELPD